ncbi:uncharacterized protein Z518_04053 [Rhinocladiella mackenziei CBS 650.93]|uniref:NWD NACHT-NTPase N-terminal domain-containing protein n=1 Tax=Rhinocladiella mackenziei CBS 650.93 TaxID=1442369 RepID=A0A0D2IK63_9EURO|nr:uncharacterized protein Z518_04053 [Rhinocladiella mackenziei CBS 650.93]KIX06079.1 hypothetical protein Z518_04053 [Rhinocladiella mackenziei CBS 650.93]
MSNGDESVRKPSPQPHQRSRPPAKRASPANIHRSRSQNLKAPSESTDKRRSKSHDPVYKTPKARTPVDAVVDEEEFTPYEQLWNDSKSEFKEKNPDLFHAFQRVEQKVVHVDTKGEVGESPGSATKEFHETVGKTKFLLDQRRWKYQKSGQKGEVRNLVTRFLVILGNLSGLGGVVANVNPVIGVPVWAGVCYCLQACLRMTQSDESALNGVREVTDIIDLYEVLRPTFYSSKPSAANKRLYDKTRKLFVNILVFQAFAVKFLSKNTGTRAARAFISWDDWKPMLEDIQREAKNCERLQEAHAQAGQKEIKEILKETRLHTKYLVELQKTNDEFDRQETIISWLSDQPVEAHLGHVLNKSEQSAFIDRKSVPKDYKAPDDWLWSDLERWWKDRKRGPGKTTLISQATQHLRRNLETDTKSQLAYFLIADEPGRRECTSVIRSLLAQLARTPEGKIASSISELYDPRGAAAKLGSNRSLQELKSLCTNYRTTLVVDGLDQCEDWNELLKALKDLTCGKTSTKLLVTSNERLWEVRGKRTFKECLEMQVNKDRNLQAIKHFCYCQIAKNSESLNNGECKDLEIKLVDRLVFNSDGIFKWVELYINQKFGNNRMYSNRDAVKDLIIELEKSPHIPDLDPIYKSILEGNPDDKLLRQVKQCAFRWTLSWAAPMTIVQLAEAVHVETHAAISRSESLIREHCADLLELKSDGTPVTIAGTTVRHFLTHYSVKEKTTIYPYSDVNCHAQILITSLRRLEYLCSIPMSGRDFQDVDWTFDLYAATFWPFHLAKVAARRSNISDFPSVIEKFFGPNITGYGSGFRLWTEKWLKVTGTKEFAAKNCLQSQFPDAFRLVTSILASPPNPFFAACALGLPPLLKALPLPEADMSQLRNINDELGAFLAVESESTECLEVLLAKKVELKKMRQSGNTILHWAAIKSWSKTLKWLLDRDIAQDASIIDDNAATILHLAAGSAKGPLTKVEILSDFGFEKLGLEANRPDKDQKTALHYALDGPRVSTKLIQKLRTLSIDFKAKDKMGATPLHYSVRNRKASEEVIKELVSYKMIDVNAVDHKKKTALAYLVEKGTRVRINNLVPILLKEEGIRVKPRNGEESVLHLAINNSVLSEKTFQLLLSHEGCKDCVDKDKRNLLHCALLAYRDSASTKLSRSRLEKIIDKLLEDKDIDVTSVDKKRATALHYLARIPTQPAGLMKTMLSKITDVDASNETGETALHILVRYNEYADKANEKAVQLLIERAKAFDMADKGGETILQRAIRNWKTPPHVITTLIQKQSTIDALDKTGCNALHYAARLRGDLISRALLKEGANASILDSDGASALHYASASSRAVSARTVKFLIKSHGLGVDAADKAGKAPVHYAARSGTLDGLQALEKQGAKFDIKDKDGNTVLHHAVRNVRRAPEILLYLLERKSVDINTRNRLGETPFLCAVRRGSVEAVKTLVKKKAKTSTKTKKGETALHYVFRRSDTSKELVELVLEQDINLVMEDETGETALQIALKAREASFDSMMAFLEKLGSDENTKKKIAATIDTKGTDGMTALQFAAKHRKADVVKILLKYGADVTLTDKSGMTAACLAAARGHEAVVKSLLEGDRKKTQWKEKDGFSPLHIAARDGNVDLVNAIVGLIAIDLKDSQQRTPLRRAVGRGHEAVVKTLLRKGADCNAKDNEGKTPLHRAAEQGYPGIARLLLAHGAAIGQKDNEGKTPLQRAVQRSHETVISTLLEHDADAEELATFKDEQEKKGSKLSNAGARDVYTRHLLQRDAKV